MYIISCVSIFRISMYVSIFLHSSFSPPSSSSSSSSSSEQIINIQNDRFSAFLPRLQYILDVHMSCYTYKGSLPSSYYVRRKRFSISPTLSFSSLHSLFLSVLLFPILILGSFFSSLSLLSLSFPSSLSFSLPLFFPSSLSSFLLFLYFLLFLLSYTFPIV
jgi:hypothetical protein